MSPSFTGDEAATVTSRFVIAPFTKLSGAIARELKLFTEVMVTVIPELIVSML